jgi:hypothetical protein
MVPSGQTGRGDFPDAVSEMDVHIGEFLDAIEDICIPNNGPEETDRTSKHVERRGQI